MQSVPCIGGLGLAGTRPQPQKVPISVPSFYLQFSVNPRVTKIVTSQYLGLSQPDKQESLTKVRSAYHFGSKPDLPIGVTSSYFLLTPWSQQFSTTGLPIALTRATIKVDLC
jgi:hypothetical protein